MNRPAAGIFCGTCDHSIDVHMTFKPDDYFEPTRSRCLTCGKVCIGPNDPSEEEVEEARRDAARSKERFRATFEPTGEDEWLCKVCGTKVRTWDEASREHLKVHGFGQIGAEWEP